MTRKMSDEEGFLSLALMAVFWFAQRQWELLAQPGWDEDWTEGELQYSAESLSPPRRLPIVWVKRALKWVIREARLATVALARAGKYELRVSYPGKSRGDVPIRLQWWPTDEPTGPVREKLEKLQVPAQLYRDSADVAQRLKLAALLGATWLKTAYLAESATDMGTGEFRWCTDPDGEAWVGPLSLIHRGVRVLLRQARVALAALERNGEAIITGKQVQLTWQVPER